MDIYRSPVLTWVIALSSIRNLELNVRPRRQFFEFDPIQPRAVEEEFFLT